MRHDLRGLRELVWVQEEPEKAKEKAVQAGTSS